MAKPKKPIAPKGTVDGLTYYNYKGEPRVRKKSSLTSERVKTDPAFEPTLVAGGRFIRLVRAVRAIRYAISPFGQAFGDSILHQRLIKALNKVVRRDKTIFGENAVDYYRLETPLREFEFKEGIVMEEIYCMHPFFMPSHCKSSVAFELRVDKDKIFRTETEASHFRILLILAPLGKATTLRAFEEDEDLGPQATIASEWFSKADGCDIRELLTIPEFMKGEWPILALMAVEQGRVKQDVVVPMEDGRVMRVLGMV
jgi:hypothetical protein